MKYINLAYKGKNNWWRFILVIIITFIGWQIIGIIPLALTANIMAPNPQAFERVFNHIAQGKDINANLYLILIISTFLFGLLALLIAVRKIHQRSIKSLLTSRKNMDWKRVFFAFAVLFSVSSILLLLDYYLSSDTYVWNFKPIPFSILVVISFLFLPLQTSFEEILFRGYLMQSIGILFKNTLIPLIFTSVVFGLMHGANPEVDKLGYAIFIYYIGTGLFFGITTLMDEGLELSLGLHAANNIVAAILVTTDWTVFKTDALLLDTSEPSLGFQAFLPVFVLYPILLFVFSKKYKWTNWRKHLIE